MAVGVMDLIYQGGILDFEQSELKEFAFARIGSPANAWADIAEDQNDLAQKYMRDFGGLRNPSDQWDKPLFKSDKATCLAVYEASQ